MTCHYTYAKQWGSNILYRGYKNGKPVIEKVPYQPTLFVPSKSSSATWKGLYDGRPLEPLKFDSIRDAKTYVENYKDVHGFEIHGFQKYEYQLINERHAGLIEYDIRDVNIQTIDIEVVADRPNAGFPDIATADTPVVLISIHNSRDDSTIVMGLKDYESDNDDAFEYRQYANEKELLKAFVVYTQSTQPDVWTGWNTDQFDIPYLVNRLMRLFDEGMVKKLSPFGIIREKKLEVRGREIQTYEIFGIVALDYLELYKKYGSYNVKESYALGFIAQEELGETKLELPGVNFYDSYNNHFRTFVKYNAIDTILVKKLETKMKLIELAFAMAYMYHCNINDIYRTVLPWEVFIYNHLAEKNIAVPPRKDTPAGSVEGAWVKLGLPGLYKWVMSFDFKGLYPHVEWQWNISPETFYPAEFFDCRTDNFLNNDATARAAIEFAKENNLTVAANGAMFKKDKQGFLPELMQFCIEGRTIAKDEMLRLESEYERTHDESLIPKIAALDNRQKALKIAANACYGALGNSGFHYYDFRIAEAVTLTGQLSDRHLADAINTKFNRIIGTEGVDYVIYGDTDSIYLNCEALVNKFMPGKSRDEIVGFLDKFGQQVCQPVINKSVEDIFNHMNAYVKVMGSKREAIASKMLFRGKKNYAMYIHNSEGVAYATPKLKVLGIEVVRSSTPQWCRKNLKAMIGLIFEKDELELQQEFKRVKTEFMQLPPEEIAFPRGVNDIDKWSDNSTIYKKGTPMHVRGSLLYNKHFSEEAPIQNGDKIKFVYLKIPNTIRENIIAFPTKFPKGKNIGKYIDYNTQFDKAFVSPLRSLTDVAGWNVEEQVSLMGGLFD